MIKLSRLSLWLFRSSWRLAWLAALFAVVLSGAATANEQPSWKNELSNMKACMLRQISYIAKLSELLKNRDLSLETYERLIAELERSQPSFEKKISDLLQQLASSEIYTANLQKEVDELASLYEQLVEKHEELLTAWNDYKQEAESQISELQEERDRARKWIPRIGLTALILGGILGALFF